MRGLLEKGKKVVDSAYHLLYGEHPLHDSSTSYKKKTLFVSIPVPYLLITGLALSAGVYDLAAAGAIVAPLKTIIVRAALSETEGRLASLQDHTTKPNLHYLIL